VKVDSYSPLLRTITGTYTHMTASKGSSIKGQRCLCVCKISHVSLLQHTDRSSEYSLLYEGQVHARRREKDVVRKTVKEWERSYNPNLSLFTLSPCLPCLCFYLSPCTLPLFSPSLRRGIQSLHWDWSSLKVIQNCTACCLSSLSALSLPPPNSLPPPPTLHPSLDKIIICHQTRGSVPALHRYLADQ